MQVIDTTLLIVRMLRVFILQTDAFFEVVENEVLVSVESERKEQIKSMLKVQPRPLDRAASLVP